MGRNVVITAGASGIGLAIAELFHERGDVVSICDVNRDALDLVASRLSGVRVFQVDVADAKAVDAFVSSLGAVDVLINNAGIAGPVGGIETNDPEDWARCFAVNVHGAFHMIRAVTPGMRRRRAGCIINISTASTVTGLPGRSAYVSSKWAVEGLTKNAARELGPANIRVNAIRPGFMDTERMRGIMARGAQERGMSISDLEQEALGFISLRTKIQPREVGEMAFFLASEPARHITGQIIGVDGNCEWEG